MKRWLENLVSYLIVTLVALVGIYELFLPGFYENHDGIIHVMRVVHVKEAILNGQLPVRWLPTWMAEYGSPVMLFIWPLPYYLAVALTFFGISAQASVEILLGSAYVLSGLAACWFLFLLTRSRVAALTGTVIYLWAPYRFIDLYVRGALGEGFAYIFFPLMFALVLKTKSDSNQVFSPLIALVWAFAILSHNLMAVALAVLYVLYLLGLTLWERLPARFLVSGLTVLVMGIGLTAWYWLPAVVEMSHTRLSSYLSQSYERNFVPLSLLIYSKWRYAYASPKTPDHTMSFQFGAVQWLVLLLSPGVGFAWWRKRKKTGLFNWLFFLLIGGGSLYLVTEKSLPAYRILPYLDIFNYPWRFLFTAVFAVAVLAAILISRIKNLKLQKLFAGLLILIALYTNWQHAGIVSYKVDLKDHEYRQMVATNIGFLPDSEFLPAGIAFHEMLDALGRADRKAHFEFIEGGAGEILSSHRRRLMFIADLSANQNTQVRLNQFYFPGWEVRLNNQPIDITADENGLITFYAPPGKSQIEAKFSNTPVRVVGNWASIASGIIFLLIILRQVKGQNLTPPV